MALQILNQPDEVLARVRGAIEDALEGAEVTVSSMSPGHFEIRVVSAAFAGLSRVKQQQLVYGAITPLMSGDAPPVHAVDRLETKAP